jgi:hypothetical protein
VQNDQTISKSNFDPRKETKILIHGFIDTPLSNWVKVIIQFKLALQNNNIAFFRKLNLFLTNLVELSGLLES